MKFYIATRLENACAHSRLRTALEARGHIITYDWTAHGSVKEDLDRLKVVCEDEVDGVLAADRVFCLMPGGRGTHVELGLAIAARKPVAMWAPDGRLFAADEQTTAFYHHSLVKHYTGDFESFVKAASTELVSQMWYGQCLVCGSCFEKESELRPYTGDDGRSHGAFCPECRKHKLVAPGVVHFKPAGSFVEDLSIRAPWL